MSTYAGGIQQMRDTDVKARLLYHYGLVGAAADVDGTTHGQLRYIGEAIATVESAIKTDDDTFTPATDKVSMIGATFDDTSPDTVNEGDAGAVRMSSRRELYTQIRDAAGNERGTNVTASNELSVLDSNSGNILTAVQIMDDWDESDRAKVNPIAGQAGIAANAGAMDALTTRITIATDDTHFGAVGAASDVDGIVHGQLRYIGEALDTLETTANAIQSAVEIIDDWDDGADHAEIVGVVAEGNAHGTTAPIQLGAEDPSGNVARLQTDASKYLKIDLAASSGAIDTELTTDDLDTGAGTDTQAIVGIGLAESGGHTLLGSGNPMPISDNGSALSIDIGGQAPQLDDTDKIATSLYAYGAAAGDSSLYVTTLNMGGTPNAHGHNGLDVHAVVSGKGSASATSVVNASGMAGGTDDLDGNTALNAASTLFARRDDDNVEYVYQDHATNHALRVSLYGKDAAAGDTELLLDSAGHVQADIIGSLPAGSNAIGTLAANSGVDIGDVTINNAAGASAVNVQDGGNSLTVDGTVTASNAAGDVAHDGSDSGNPVKVGQKTIAHGANPTAVAAGDRTDWYANRHGIPFVIPGHPNIVTIRANYTAAQTDTAIVTIASGNKIVVTRCSVTVDNACSVDVAARIGFGTANTPATTGVVLSHPGIAAGSGVVEGSGSGILGIGADDEDLRITSEVPTGGSIDVVVSYYTIES